MPYKNTPYLSCALAYVLTCLENLKTLTAKNYQRIRSKLHNLASKVFMI